MASIWGYNIPRSSIFCKLNNAKHLICCEGDIHSVLVLVIECRKLEVIKGRGGTYNERLCIYVADDTCQLFPISFYGQEAVKVAATLSAGDIIAVEEITCRKRTTDDSHVVAGGSVSERSKTCCLYKATSQQHTFTRPQSSVLYDAVTELVTWARKQYPNIYTGASMADDIDDILGSSRRKGVSSLSDIYNSSNGDTPDLCGNVAYSSIISRELPFGDSLSCIPREAMWVDISLSFSPPVGSSGSIFVGCLSPRSPNPKIGTGTDMPPCGRRWRCRDRNGSAVFVTFPSHTDFHKAMQELSTITSGSGCEGNDINSKLMDSDGKAASSLTLLLSQVLVLRSKEDGVIRELLLAEKSILIVLTATNFRRDAPSRIHRLFPAAQAHENKQSQHPLSSAPTVDRDSIKGESCFSIPITSLPDSLPGSIGMTNHGNRSHGRGNRKLVVKSFQSVCEGMESNDIESTIARKRQRDTLPTLVMRGKNLRRVAAVNRTDDTIEHILLRKCRIADIRVLSSMGLVDPCSPSCAVPLPSSVLDLLVISSSSPPLVSQYPPVLSSVSYKPLQVLLTPDDEGGDVNDDELTAYIENECMMRLMGNIPAALVWHCAARKNATQQDCPAKVGNIVAYDYAAAADRVYCALRRAVVSLVTKDVSGRFETSLFDAELRMKKSSIDGSCDLHLYNIREVSG